MSDQPEAYRAEVVGPVAVCAHLRGEPNAAMAWLSEHLGEMCKTGSNVGAVLILREGATPPDDAKRKAFSTILRAPAMKGFAVVVLGGGFWAEWQGAYALAQTKVLELGDRIRIECAWDNSAANQPVVDGQPIAPRDTVWGEGTLDEMCLGAFYLSK